MKVYRRKTPNKWHQVVAAGKGGRRKCQKGWEENRVFSVSVRVIMLMKRTVKSLVSWHKCP